MKLLKWLAKKLLNYRAQLQWRELENHIATCDKRICRYYREHGIPEDQDYTMFCYKGGKIWERNWDISFHANSIPD